MPIPSAFLLLSGGGGTLKNASSRLSVSTLRFSSLEGKLAFDNAAVAGFGLHAAGRLWNLRRSVAIMAANGGQILVPLTPSIIPLGGGA